MRSFFLGLVSWYLLYLLFLDGISFPRFWKFASLILWKVFTIPLAYNSPPFMSIIYRFDLFMVTWVSCTWNLQVWVFEKSFSFIGWSHLSTMSSSPDILFHEKVRVSIELSVRLIEFFTSFFISFWVFFSVSTAIEFIFMSQLSHLVQLLWFCGLQLVYSSSLNSFQ